MNSILTVITVAESYDLTVVETVKAELGITGGDHDEILGRYIKEASEAISVECNRVFAEETVLETFYHKRGGSPLMLERTPVSDITSISVDATALTTDEYLLKSDTGQLYRLLNTFPASWSSSEIAITYTGGYELLDDLPFSVERACISLVKHFWFSRRRDPMVKQIAVEGVGSRSYWVGATGDSSDLPPDVLNLLNGYRRSSADWG